MSDREIAKIIGVDHWTVGRIRNGINRPGNAFIEKAEQATGRSFDELFYDEATPAGGSIGAVPALQGAEAVP